MHSITQSVTLLSKQQNKHSSLLIHSKTSDIFPRPDFEQVTHRGKFYWSLNSRKTESFGYYDDSDSYFMNHCLEYSLLEHTVEKLHTITAHCIGVWCLNEGVFRVSSGAHRCLDSAHARVWWIEFKLLHGSVGIPIWCALQSWHNAANISPNWCCTLLNTVKKMKSPVMHAALETCFCINRVIGWICLLNLQNEA